MMEYRNALAEDPGSEPNTLYVTNIREPVERSLSHFKYNARWDCEQMVKNESFVPTLKNAQPIDRWNETGGFEPYPCEVPFVFHHCAVNCYIQAFSGQSCSETNWQHEYLLAQRRLFRYNIIFSYKMFKDPRYVKAVEGFFGVEGFNQRRTDMFCGPESHEANSMFPLSFSFSHVLKLEKLNSMDEKFYEEATSCGWGEKSNNYNFPKVNLTRLKPHENRTVIGRT
mmetsp:Transcript_17096/g.39766  ORF Transcript_17096/g.39766 Transcript_17096/m.39766 type:complete len:226 (+) Transcript_17096:476-1153(+)